MAIRDDLVRVGGDLLERDGLAALTLRRIAREAGVSHGAPRHHFPTYEALLAVIARTGVEDLDAELSPCLAMPDAREALAAAARCYVGFAVRRPEMFELIARHDLLAGAGARLREVTAPWFETATRRVTEVRPGADRRDALALWAGVHGLAVILSRQTAEALTPRVPEVDPVLDVLLSRLLGQA